MQFSEMGGIDLVVGISSGALSIQHSFVQALS